MSHRCLLAIIAMLIALQTYASESVGFSEVDTCQTVVDTELARGSRLEFQPEPAYPELKAYFGTQVFSRLHNGSAATIIYLCTGRRDSGGSLNAQLIYLKFQSEADARAEYARQRLLIEQQLGKPCWDASAIQVEGLPPRVIWSVRSGIQTDITWSKVVNREPLHWIVLIGTHGLVDTRNASEPFRSEYAASSCEKVNGNELVFPPPNTLLERTRER